MKETWFQNPLDTGTEDGLIIFLQIICRIVNPTAKFAKDKFGNEAVQKIGLVIGSILGEKFYEEPSEIKRFEQIFPEFHKLALSQNLFLDSNPVSEKLLTLLESTKILECSDGEFYQYFNDGLGLG
ncbi:MAG TPA: hypothetical protein V6D28_08790 [Leptolyngbyaceae cyanobacterium]|nr:hypothetical protein [Nostocaceae cyanobacterium]